MASADWFSLLESADKIALAGTGTRKIHYKFADGREMVEEYNLETGVLTKRAWKKSNILKSSKWDVEVGDALSECPEENIGLTESKDAPFVSHRVTKTKLEWRVRNFKYSSESDYNVSLDQSDKCIIIRTSDKKFYKKIPILDLQRLNLPVTSNSLRHSRSLNTLVIQYEKPPELLAFEKKLATELKNVRVVDDKDMDCRPS
ncbi:hypothetical protein V9T40_010953 [Parthenolecanium corni]|uniref:Protein DPCD n=1 Tax=Parthenolecanium corni TaxID=536013 RepID=A0AAN9XXY7_9HEMI